LFTKLGRWQRSNQNYNVIVIWSLLYSSSTGAVKLQCFFIYFFLGGGGSIWHCSISKYTIHLYEFYIQVWTRVFGEFKMNLYFLIMYVYCFYTWHFFKWMQLNSYEPGWYFRKRKWLLNHVRCTYTIYQVHCNYCKWRCKITKRKRHA
jgi:hypothetical protein